MSLKDHEPRNLVTQPVESPPAEHLNGGEERNDDPAIPAQSATEQAVRRFKEEIRKVAGVQVECRGGPHPADQYFRVYVPTLRSPEADQVFDLEADVARQFPGSRFVVQVRAHNGLGNV